MLSAAAAAVDLMINQQQQQTSSSWRVGKLARHEAPIETLEANPGWVAYVESLTRSGYFQGNIAGSAADKERLAAAQKALIK